MQKTAYEVRISDWSADVCSSDLDEADGHRVLDAEARSDGRAKRHDRRRARVLELLRRNGIVRAVNHHVEAVLHQPHGGAKRDRKSVVSERVCSAVWILVGAGALNITHTS